MHPKYEKLIVDVKIQDLNRAIDFYKDTLGLPLIQKESEWASFEAMGAEIHLYIHSGIQSGLEFRVIDLKTQVEALKSKGVEFYTEQNQANLLGIDNEIMTFPWGKAAFLKDSEGNRIVLVEDT
jgi:catechol 2,3-dioxygenase-like lactoylglutathione lyase family enzyme